MHPLLQKDIVVPALVTIWQKALDQMSQAEEIHVIGYSAPRADQAAIELLNGAGKEGLRRVVIVNPEEPDRRRIQAFLGVPDKLVKPYQSFEEYETQGQVLHSHIAHSRELRSRPWMLDCKTPFPGCRLRS